VIQQEKRLIYFFTYKLKLIYIQAALKSGGGEKGECAAKKDGFINYKH
jgi:hypothetical protein